LPTKDNYWLLRIGSGAAVLGALFAGVGNLLHRSPRATIHPGWHA
jgi:hypothetical protein